MGVGGEKLGMCIYACIGEVSRVPECGGEGMGYVHICMHWAVSGVYVFRNRRCVLDGFIPIPSDDW